MKEKDPPPEIEWLRGLAAPRSDDGPAIAALLREMLKEKRLAEQAIRALLPGNRDTHKVMHYLWVSLFLSVVRLIVIHAFDVPTRTI